MYIRGLLSNYKIGLVPTGYASFPDLSFHCLCHIREYKTVYMVLVICCADHGMSYSTWLRTPTATDVHELNLQVAKKQVN